MAHLRNPGMPQLFFQNKLFCAGAHDVLTSESRYHRSEKCSGRKDPTDKIVSFFLINSDFVINECL